MNRDVVRHSSFVKSLFGEAIESFWMNGLRNFSMNIKKRRLMRYNHFRAYGWIFLQAL